MSYENMFAVDPTSEFAREIHRLEPSDFDSGIESGRLIFAGTEEVLAPIDRKYLPFWSFPADLREARERAYEEVESHRNRLEADISVIYSARTVRKPEPAVELLVGYWNRRHRNRLILL